MITVSNEKKPKVKIVGFDDLHMNEEEIEEAMRQQNSSLFGEEEHLKVVKVYESKKNKKLKNIIAEVDPHKYQQLMKIGAVNIKWSKCKIFNGIEIMRCFKCSRFSHKVCCPRCMGDHNLIDHPRDDKEERCINCHEANKKFNMKMDEKHAVWSDDCTTHQRSLKNLMRNMKCKNTES